MRGITIILAKERNGQKSQYALHKERTYDRIRLYEKQRRKTKERSHKVAL